jgi:phosphatidate cytidylyltransferase
MEMAGRISAGWQPAPRGLAWALVVVLVTWIGDSVAYLAGTSIGNRKLATAISPNKTVAGSVGGLVGAMAIGVVLFQSFGLGEWWVGLMAGTIIGLAGQIGDLAESILKRQASVKDSGTMIPGHGGILDRIDALLFAFPAGFLLAAGLERIGS